MSQKQNRHKIKQWFFTFPKSGDLTRQEFINSLMEFGEAEFAKCVQETHKDGSKHLHAIYKFQNGVTKTSILKYLKDEYPNDWKRIHLEPVRSMLKAQQYVEKEDTSPYIIGEYKETRGRVKSTGMKKQIAKEIAQNLFYRMKCIDIEDAYLQEMQNELYQLRENSENSEYEQYLIKKIKSILEKSKI